MSFAYSSTAFSCRTSVVPDRLENADEILHFISENTSHAYRERKTIEASIPLPIEVNTPENRFRRNREIEERTLLASLVLSGSSRSGWFERVVGNIVSAYGLKSLEFLTDQEDQMPYVWPDESWRYRFTVLNEAQAALAKRDIEEILNLSRKDPQRIGDLTEDGWSGEDVIEAISETGVAQQPSFVFGDEGQGLMYLFAFFRSLLLVLEDAIGNHGVVVCFQRHPD